MNTDRELFYIGLIKESSSLIEVCRKADIVPTTGNYDTLKRLIAKYNIDTSHFKRNGGSYSTVKRTTQEYLDNKYPITSFKLKNRLIKEGYKLSKCENCGRDEWCGKPIPLELHHINGDNNDNSLSNLQILCPNCHAFTDTYSGKNQKSNIKKRFCKRCGKELHDGQKVFCSFECRYPNRKSNNDKLVDTRE